MLGLGRPCATFVKFRFSFACLSAEDGADALVGRKSLDMIEAPGVKDSSQATR
jgi:hypothetical protein